MRTWRWPHFVIVVLALLLPGFAVAAEAEPATLQIYNRDIVTFRAPLTSHGMLLEGARRTRGILMQPEPYVVQTALSDYYVEYRLVAVAGPEAPVLRAEAMSILHASILDVFNEYGVQIMSPNYRGDPAEPKLVPRARWFEAPAEPPSAERPS